MTLIEPALARRGGIPQCPQDIAETVELYAREQGRTATVHFVPTLLQGRHVVRGSWMARFSLRSNDKRMIAFKQGMAAEPPTEDVWFHEPNPAVGQIIKGTDGQRESEFRGLDIVQMGSSGVRTFLEKGNTWSGRGVFKSIEDQLRLTRESEAQARVEHREKAKIDSRLQQREKRRWWQNLPLLNVLENIGKRKESGVATGRSTESPELRPHKEKVS